MSGTIILDPNASSPTHPGLALATKARNHIPNEPRPQQHPERLKEARRLHEKGNRRVRSLSSTYNCMGMVFAARRTWIDTEHFAQIISEDGYRRLRDSDLKQPGDVVVYREGSEVVHVGIIVEIDVSEPRTGLRVLSQWGHDGEYFHDAHDLPSALTVNGPPLIEVWTDRKGT